MPCKATIPVPVPQAPDGLAPFQFALPATALDIDLCCKRIPFDLPGVQIKVVFPPELGLAIKAVNRVIRVYLHSIPLECPRE